MLAIKEKTPKKKHEQHPATRRDPFPDLLFTLTGACRSAALEILVSEEARSRPLSMPTQSTA